jgi:uncharacterized protein
MPLFVAFHSLGPIVMCRLQSLFRFLILLVAVAGFAPAMAQQDVPVPQLTARVTDTTGTLDQGQKQALEAKLQALEEKKGAQVFVLMVPTVQPDTVESYSRRVFDQWKVGRANVDDGILFLIAKNDRRMRLEVGYGLEGAVPDALASRIINDYVSPHFKTNDYAGGVNAGVTALASLIENETLPAPERKPAGDSDTFDEGLFGALGPMLMFGFFLIAFFPPVISAVAAGVMLFAITGNILWAGLAAIAALVISGIARKVVPRGAVRGARRNGAILGGLGGLGGGFGSGRGGGGFGGGGFGGGFGGGGGGSSGGGGASGGW